MPIHALSPLLASATSILVAILGVGFLIFVHELGHFLACRLTGTRVETFSIGFGTRLFGWESLPEQPRRFTVGRRRLDPADHAMDFRVAMVPLGGYVKMAGENPGEEKSGAPDEFPSQPIWARVFIVSAGVLMNFLAAVVLYALAFANHVEQRPAVVGHAITGGPAWHAGLQSGDRILSLGGRRLRSFTDLRMESVFLEPGVEAKADVERGGERLSLPVVPAYDESTGAVMLQVVPPVVLQVQQDGKRIEIAATDSVEIDGIPVRGGAAALTLLSDAWTAKGGAPVEVHVPGGETLQLRFQDGNVEGDATWRIGIEPWGPTVVETVRGRAADHFQPGDRLVRAETGGGPVLLERAGDVDQLPFRAPIESLVVERSGAEHVVEVSLDTPAAAYALFHDMAFARPEGARVAPLGPGTVAPLGENLARYPNSPAGDAGLRAGDLITAIGSSEVTTWGDVLREVQKHAGPEPLEVTVRGADEAARKLTIAPVALAPLESGSIRVLPALEAFETDGVLDAVGVAIKRTGREIRNIFRLIGAFFTGNISFQRNVAGPATIVTVSAGAVEQSTLSFFLFLAYISVTLAVLNILPIPILDGGHLLFILIEKIKGSPLKDETMGRLQFVGMMLLLVLMFFAFRNDFINLTQ